MLGASDTWLPTSQRYPIEAETKGGPGPWCAICAEKVLCSVYGSALTILKFFIFQQEADIFILNWALYLMWAYPGEEKHQGLISVSVTEPGVNAQGFPLYIPTVLLYQPVSFLGPQGNVSSPAFQLYSFMYSFLVEFTIFGINSYMYV